MKKVILILAVILTVVGCQKNSNKSLAPASTSGVYCIFYNQTCVGCQPRVFYKCASTQSEMQQACVTLRDQNKEYEVVEKSTCSDCN